MLLHIDTTIRIIVFDKNVRSNPKALLAVMGFLGEGFGFGGGKVWAFTMGVHEPSGRTTELTELSEPGPKHFHSLFIFAHNADMPTRQRVNQVRVSTDWTECCDAGTNGISCLHHSMRTVTGSAASPPIASMPSGRINCNSPQESKGWHRALLTSSDS